MLHDRDKYFYLRTTVVNLAKMPAEKALQFLVNLIGADCIAEYLSDFYGCKFLKENNNLESFE